MFMTPKTNTHSNKTEKIIQKTKNIKKQKMNRFSEELELIKNKQKLTSHKIVQNEIHQQTEVKNGKSCRQSLTTQYSTINQLVTNSNSREKNKSNMHLKNCNHLNLAPLISFQKNNVFKRKPSAILNSLKTNKFNHVDLSKLNKNLNKTNFGIKGTSEFRKKNFVYNKKQIYSSYAKKFKIEMIKYKPLDYINFGMKYEYPINIKNN